MVNFMRWSFRTRHQLKLWGHIAALTLAVTITAIAGARMIIRSNQAKAVANPITTNGGKRSMSGQIALSMGAKSILIILYQMLAEHTRVFKERPKVNMILCIIEQIAWPAVVAFTVQGILNTCSGTTCILSWIIIPLAVIMSLVALLSAFIAIGDWQYFKKTGVLPSQAEDSVEHKNSSTEEVSQMRY